jgi:hypothetical protein
MDQQSEPSELVVAWRALSGTERKEGWTSIQLMSIAPCQVRAGRHFPGNEEALLVGFRSLQVPAPDQLPLGRGFSVTRIDPPPDTDNRAWICLARQQSGSIDMFEMMANDVLAALELRPAASEKEALSLFISRVRAWQNFMQRDSAVLDAAAEIGLIGELVVLNKMLKVGLPATNAIESWQGPLDGLHDFALASGALEVKTTISTADFIVNVDCLEQLDPSLVSPLYLAAVRLVLSPTGFSLPEQIRDARALMSSDTYSLEALNVRLIRAGYVDAVAARYTRRFHWAATTVLAVQASFPSLTRGNVPAEIREARYKLDISCLNAIEISFDAALKSLGVM